MDTSDFRHDLQKQLREYQEITQNELIQDPSNEIKRWYSNFSIVYHKDIGRDDTNPTGSRWMYLTKSATTGAYSTFDFYAERFSNISYIPGDVQVKRVIPRQDSLNKDITHHVVSQKKKKTEANSVMMPIEDEENKKLYLSYLQEHGLLQDSFYIRYLIDKAIKRRILLYRHCTDSLCLCKKPQHPHQNKGETTSKNKSKSSSVSLSFHSSPLTKDMPKRRRDQKDSSDQTQDEDDTHTDDNDNNDTKQGHRGSGKSLKKTLNASGSKKSRKSSPNHDLKEFAEETFDNEHERTREREHTDYGRHLPFHMFFVDNPTERGTVSNTTLIKSFVFDLVGQVSENLSEIIMFVKEKPKPPKVGTVPSTEETETLPHDASSSSSSSSALPTQPAAPARWINSLLIKQQFDRLKDNQRCWYPPRRSVPYPPPQRKTSNTSKVTFFVSRLLKTDATFWNDRPILISGCTVRNALQEHQKLLASFTDPNTATSSATTDGIHMVDDVDQIVSPFIPVIENIGGRIGTPPSLMAPPPSPEFIANPTASASPSSSSTTTTTTASLHSANQSNKHNSGHLPIFHQDFGRYIEFGPIGTALKNELNAAKRQLAQKWIAKPTVKGTQADQDVMVVSDGFHIGLVHNKSFENLGSYRIHPSNNANIPIVSRDYLSSFNRECGPNERPCCNMKDCIHNKPKSRQDILESRHQKSQSFIAVEFLLPDAYTRFRYGDGKLPNEHGPCAACLIQSTNLMAARMRQYNLEPVRPIQKFGVFVDCPGGFKASDCLPYTYGPNDTFTGFIAPFPYHREENYVYVMVDGVKRAHFNTVDTHFYTASITHLKKGSRSIQRDKSKDNSDWESNTQENTNANNTLNSFQDNLPLPSPIHPQRHYHHSQQQQPPQVPTPTSSQDTTQHPLQKEVDFVGKILELRAISSLRAIRERCANSNIWQ
jgi:hypothetical protein